MLTLEVTKRNAKDNVESLRKEGKIPAVFYGKKNPATSITVSAKEFVKVFKEAGESSVIKLEGDGVDVEALIHDADVHPVNNKIRHADFYVFEKGKKIEIDVPLEFSGIAPAIKDLGGTLVKVLYTIKISALPKDLPHKIVVDISSLKEFSSVIKAKDLVLPTGVSLEANLEDMIASIMEPKEEVEEETKTIDLSTIEVEKKGKDAKEGEEGEEAVAEPAGKAGGKAKKE